MTAFVLLRRERCHGEEFPAEALMAPMHLGIVRQEDRWWFSLSYGIEATDASDASTFRDLAGGVEWLLDSGAFEEPPPCAALAVDPPFAVGGRILWMFRWMTALGTTAKDMRTPGWPGTTFDGGRLPGQEILRGLRAFVARLREEPDVDAPTGFKGAWTMSVLASGRGEP